MSGSAFDFAKFHFDTTDNERSTVEILMTVAILMNW